MRETVKPNPYRIGAVAALARHIGAKDIPARCHISSCGMPTYGLASYRAAMPGEVWYRCDDTGAYRIDPVTLERI